MIFLSVNARFRQVEAHFVWRLWLVRQRRQPQLVVNNKINSCGTLVAMLDCGERGTQRNDTRSN